MAALCQAKLPETSRGMDEDMDEACIERIMKEANLSTLPLSQHPSSPDSQTSTHAYTGSDSSHSLPHCATSSRFNFAGSDSDTSRSASDPSQWSQSPHASEIHSPSWNAGAGHSFNSDPFVFTAPPSSALNRSRSFTYCSGNSSQQ